ncbi:hypothetical protein GCM10011581_46010 [Saccharopolyspora subtropica]|uniref:Uncharacterized protein n=1 Tax=Saccharopolyspora thermophila TaxID=89367 RepID=A0A917K982_9PSEU|nr:hypothetical protein [Saccharopolyspora subtropica]GGJ03749.1 hypothetical protein GCM10011581_46010 [Saccharopolyspora subtropica]
MVATPNDLTQLAGQGWLRPGESLHRIFERRPGFLASTVAGHSRVPHAPVNPVPTCTQPVSEDYPEPSELVARGEHLGDEWVHDRGIRGWATAAEGRQLAVQVADVLTAGNGYAWLVATTQRLAVVIPARFVEQPPAPLVTWWEQPPSAVRGVRDVVLGRTFLGAPFAQLDFADGSTLLLRR